MHDTAREKILSRLRKRRAEAPVSDFSVMARKTWPAGERYARLKRMMESVQAEFLESTSGEWPRAIFEFLRVQNLSTLLYGPQTPAGRRLAGEWPSDGPRLIPYDRPIEEMKRGLFEEIDAGFTTTLGGIAETGGLILWPSPQEPRLLSLVPPVHIALLETEKIHNTFWEALRSERWSQRMPPNALLISGPSKTADIEQTLAYGVHGPRRLVVVAVSGGLGLPDPGSPSTS